MTFPLYYGSNNALFAQGAAAQSYSDKVNALSPIAYWRHTESSGTTADNFEGTADRDGTFARNVTDMGTETGIGDGETSPTFDGSNDTNDVYSSSLNTAFNGSEGTLSIWIRASSQTIWDSSTQRMFAQFRVDGNNQVFINHNSAIEEIAWRYFAGGTLESVLKDTISSTDWIHIAQTWSATAGADGEFKAYFNGTQEGSTQTALGSFSGNLATTRCNVGAATTTPVQVWSGGVAHCALFTSALTGANITSLATV